MMFMDYHNHSYTRPISSSVNDFVDHNRYKWEGREAYLLEHQQNQDLVLTLSQDIKKSVNDSMEVLLSVYTMK